MAIDDDGDGDGLPKRDTKAIGSDTSSTSSCWSQLSDVEGADYGSTTNTNTEDQATDDELSKTEAKSDDDGTPAVKKEVRNQQAGLSSPLVSKHAQD